MAGGGSAACGGVSLTTRAYTHTVVTTMAFTGYPRVGNRVGSLLVRAWQRAGGLVRDLDSLLAECGFDVADREIGGFGSIHLYVATRR